jgi:hypothetical protein
MSSDAEWHVRPDDQVLVDAGVFGSITALLARQGVTTAETVFRLQLWFLWQHNAEKLCKGHDAPRYIIFERFRWPQPDRSITDSDVEGALKALRGHVDAFMQFDDVRHAWRTFAVESPVMRRVVSASLQRMTRTLGEGRGQRKDVYVVLRGGGHKGDHLAVYYDLSNMLTPREAASLPDKHDSAARLRTYNFTVRVGDWLRGRFIVCGGSRNSRSCIAAQLNGSTSAESADCNCACEDGFLVLSKDVPDCQELRWPYLPALQLRRCWTPPVEACESRDRLDAYRQQQSARRRLKARGITASESVMSIACPVKRPPGTATSSTYTEASNKRRLMKKMEDMVKAREYGEQQRSLRAALVA